MAKHTLRNLSEEQNIIPKSKPKKSAPKTSLKPLIIPIIAVIILIIFAIIAISQTYFKEHYYVTAEYLNIDNKTSSTAFTTFCLIIIFPLAIGFYALIRSIQKKQRIMALICGITILFAITSPLLTMSILDGIAGRHADQTMLAISAPGELSCSMVGYNNRDKSDCPAPTYIPFSADMPEGIFLPIKDGENYISVYLDQHKNINNFDQQDIKVCTVTPNATQTYRCHDFKYSANSSDSDSDEYYKYTYSGNTLTVAPAEQPKTF